MSLIIPFAFSSIDKKLYSPADAMKFDKDGEKIKYICPCCKEEVILKKGELVIHHFSHKKDSLCTINPKASVQTALHYKAKELFEKRKDKWIYIPSLEPFFRESKFYYNEVIIEKKLENIIPDVVLVSKEGRKLIIEIKVSNGINSLKFEKIYDLGISCLEIDISELKKDFLDFEESFLEDIIFTNKNSYDVSKNLIIPNLTYLKRNLEPLSIYKGCEDKITLEMIEKHFEKKIIFEDFNDFLFESKENILNKFIDLQKELDKNIKYTNNEKFYFSSINKHVVFKYGIRDKELDYRGILLKKLDNLLKNLNKSSKFYNYKIIMHYINKFYYPDFNFWKKELESFDKLFIRKIPDKYAEIYDIYFSSDILIRNKMLGIDIWNKINSFIGNIDLFFNVNNLVIGNRYGINLFTLFCAFNFNKVDYKESIVNSFLDFHKEDIKEFLFEEYFVDEDLIINIKNNSSFILEIYDAYANSYKDIYNQINLVYKYFYKTYKCNICNKEYFVNNQNLKDYLVVEIKNYLEEEFKKDVQKDFQNDFESKFNIFKPYYSLGFDETFNITLKEFKNKKEYNLDDEKINNLIIKDIGFVNNLRIYKNDKLNNFTGYIKQSLYDFINNISDLDKVIYLTYIENSPNFLESFYDKYFTDKDFIITENDLQNFILNNENLMGIINFYRKKALNNFIEEYQQDIISEIQLNFDYDFIKKCFSESELNILERILLEIDFKDEKINFLLKNKFISIEESVFSEFFNELMKIIVDYKPVYLEVINSLNKNSGKTKKDISDFIKDKFKDINTNYIVLYVKVQCFLENLI